MYTWEFRDSLTQIALRAATGGEGRWMGKVGRQPMVKQSEAMSDPALTEFRKESPVLSWEPLEAEGIWASASPQDSTLLSDPQAIGPHLLTHLQPQDRCITAQPLLSSGGRLSSTVVKGSPHVREVTSSNLRAKRNKFCSDKKTWLSHWDFN